MTDIDERRDQYVPLDSQIAFKRTGEALLTKWGIEGLGAWMLLLAAAKREPVQGTFTFASEAEAWSKIGATPVGFTLDEFLTVLGRRKQTSRRTHGRLTYLSITNWGRWNAIHKRRRDAAQKSSKRHESTTDIEATEPGQASDIKAPRARGSEGEYEGEGEEEQLLAPQTKTRKPDLLWDTLAAELGEVATKSERGRRNKALAELREIGAEPDAIRNRIHWWKEHWADVTCTETGLVANWTVLGQNMNDPAMTNGHRTPEQKEADRQAHFANVEAMRREKGWV